MQQRPLSMRWGKKDGWVSWKPYTLLVASSSIEVEGTPEERGHS